MDRSGHLRRRARQGGAHRDARCDDHRGQRRRPGDVVARLPRPQGARAPNSQGGARAAREMIEVPEVRYATNRDVHIAYQTAGEGPPDIIFIWGPFSNIEVVWEHPPARRFLERLASIGRLITFDKRGRGLSDRAGEVPGLEEQMDDVTAVMDAVGSERAVLMGGGDAGLMTTLFA